MMSTLQPSASSDTTIRLQDYISDKLQTFADLENVDELLASVKEHQDVLRKQLSEARQSSSDAEAEYKDHASKLELRAVAFQEQQAELDAHLQNITQSGDSDEAVRKFETRMSKVRRLDIGKGYLDTLRTIDTLQKEAQENIETKPRVAVAASAKLQSIAEGLVAAQPAAEGAAPHLVDQVGQYAVELRHKVQTRLEDQLRKTLERMTWPNKELKLPGRLVEEWSEQVELLLQLQEPTLLKHAERLDNRAGDGVVLLPLQVMTEPLELRFAFHFYGDKPTNRLDKPEYFLFHIFDLLDQHNGILVDLLQPILDERQDIHDEAVYADALSSFITSLLPMVEKKCLSLLPQVARQPQLLSHLIHELMSFDHTLRDDWAYHPGPGPLFEWKGLTWTMLTTHGYFDAWLNVEKDFALNRYEVIQEAMDSAEIDFDSTGRLSTKPTKGAIRVTDLFEQITDRYKMLASFSQKMKFLIDVQLSILDKYHNFLHGALQAYRARTHTTGRLIQGESAGEALGMKGMQSVAKIYASCDYLEKKMADWSDDIFFLELWAELEDRASRDRANNARIGTGLTMYEVAAKTSMSIKNDDIDSGAIFDETAVTYRLLKEASEKAIISAMERHIHNSISPYLEVGVWTSLSSSGPSTTVSHSAALDSLLQTLSKYLDFLVSVLGPAPLRKVTKTVCQTIQREIYYSVLLKNTFSAAGATQLQQDVATVCSTMDSSIKMTGETQRSMRVLGDALVLLGLGLKASGKTSNEEEEGWGFDENDDATTNETNIGTDEEGTYGLWEAERLIFQSDSSARKVLSDLGLENLTVAEARNVIKRRVEINS